MTTSSIPSSMAYTAPAMSQSNSTNQNSGGENNSASQVSGNHHHSGGSNVMNAIEQTLSQMGATSTPSQTTNTTGTTAASTTNGSSTDQRQALHAFMHDLFGALKAQYQTSGTGASGGANASSQVQPVQSGYSDLSAKLQSLASSLGTSPQSGTSSNLQTDFNNLVSSLGGASSSGDQSANLQTFLQNLAQNLSGQQSASSTVGAVVSTAV